MNQLEDIVVGNDRENIPLVKTLSQRYAALLAQGFPENSFELRLPDHSSHLIGKRKPSFTIKIVNERGLRAVSSFDEISIAEAYMNGEVDIEGEMLKALKCRAMFTDNHPLHYLWVTYFAAFLLGQKSRDENWIKSHYDIDPEFFVLWLDKKIRGYSHGFFESDDESLEIGMERKFKFALDACGIKPGDRVLDIGGGWGSFLEYAGEQGVRVTSLTISDESVNYMNDLIERKGLPCKALKEHFLTFKCDEPYDAIVNLGVTEHLPDYRRTLRQYERLLKPGRRVYLDAYSGDRFGMPSFVTKWVFQGNTSPLCLHKYLTELSRTSFELVLIQNDRHNYYLTCKKWAENLEKVRDTVVSRWSEHLYRRFRLYLWASANSFLRGTLEAHRLILELPK